MNRTGTRTSPRALPNDNVSDGPTDRSKIDFETMKVAVPPRGRPKPVVLGPENGCAAKKFHKKTRLFPAGL
jgi:hypothetical protein